MVYASVFLSSVQNSQKMASIWYIVVFKCILHAILSLIFRKYKKCEPFWMECIFTIWPKLQNYSIVWHLSAWHLSVIFYSCVWHLRTGFVSTEDLAVRKIFLDPDRVCFKFYWLILIFLISVFFYLLSTVRRWNGGELTKNYRNPTIPVLQPFIRRYGWTLWVIGCRSKYFCCTDWQFDNSNVL